MFVSMSRHKPKPGKEPELVDSMHRYGAAGKGLAGLRSIHTLLEEGTGDLIGIAIWESREAWAAGRPTLGAAVANDPFEEWEDDVTGSLLEEV